MKTLSKTLIAILILVASINSNAKGIGKQKSISKAEFQKQVKELIDHAIVDKMDELDIEYPNTNTFKLVFEVDENQVPKIIHIRGKQKNFKERMMKEIAKKEFGKVEGIGDQKIYSVKLTLMLKEN